MTRTAAPRTGSPHAPAVPAAPAFPVRWTDLVEDALLGTNRRASPGLLDRAAAATLARRAGLSPAPAPEPPAPAPTDDRPPLPPAAARRLAALLAENSSELLPQWLATARARGFAAPPELLPPLLDAARQRSDLRPDSVAFAGPRGRWLAALNPDWRYVLRIPAPNEAARPVGDAADPGSVLSGSAGDTIWQEGLFAERVTHLTRLRREDPEAGLTLLRSTWGTERAEDRLLFLDALQEGLGPDDEAFLEAALTDRAKNVRATAAELLSTLPGSALAIRMTERARQAVGLGPRPGLGDGPSGGTAGPDDVLTVVPPAACDAAMQRDGIAATSPTGRGDRAFWLGEIIAATPLSCWSELVGSSDAPATPERVLALAGAPEWADELREGWARAAVRQHDAGWARALLAERRERGTTPPGPSGAQSRLLGVLPASERAAWTARFVAEQGLADAFQLLVTCPAPWPDALSETVLDALARAARAGSYPWSHSGVLGVAERSLPFSAAARVDELAGEASAAWAEVLGRLARTLRTRAAMLDELAPSPAPDPRRDEVAPT